MLRTSFLSSFVDFRSVVAESKMPQPIRGKNSNLCWPEKHKVDTEHLVLASCQVSSKSIQPFTAAQGYKPFYLLWPWPLTSKINRFQFFFLRKICAKQDQNALNSLITIVFTRLFPLVSIAMVRRYPPNPRGTKKVNPFRYSRFVHTLHVLSFSCVAMGINLVQNKGPCD